MSSASKITLQQAMDLTDHMKRFMFMHLRRRHVTHNPESREIAWKAAWESMVEEGLPAEYEVHCRSRFFANRG